MPKSKVKDLVGKIFGRLTVERFVECQTTYRKDGTRSNNLTWWECRCLCGVRVTVTARHLADGSTISCGCYQRDITKLISRRVPNRNRVDSAKAAIKYQKEIIAYPDDGSLGKPQTVKSRLTAVCKMRESGQTFAEIGKHFGVSRQAIHKFWTKHAQLK